MSAHKDPTSPVTEAYNASKRSILEACSIIEGFDGESHPEEDRVAAFQFLIDTGVVWGLQGMYGREAYRLIQAGRCTLPVRLSDDELRQKFSR
jgi:hypothetical protein